MKKTLIRSLLLPLATLALAPVANATIVVDDAAAYEVIANYSVDIYKPDFGYGQLVTDEFLDVGMTFSPYAWYTPVTLDTGPLFTNYDFNGTAEIDGFDIEYAQPMLAAGFLIYASAEAEYTVTSFFEGDVVDSLTLSNTFSTAPRLVAFIDETIDTVRVESDDWFALSYLAHQPAPAKVCDLNADGTVDRRDLFVEFRQCRLDNQGDPHWRRICRKQALVFIEDCNLPEPSATRVPLHA